jgi:hypothetical protein
MPKLRISHPADGATIVGIPLQMDKQGAFVAFGRALEPNLLVKAVLRDEAGNEFKSARKIVLSQAPKWVVLFEEVLLDKKYKLEVYDAAKPSGQPLRTATFTLKGPGHGSLAITNPTSNTTLCPDCVCYGHTDEDSPVTGAMNDGTQSFPGNTMYQSSTTGVFAIQFSNLPLGSGYELDVTNAAGTMATPSTGLTVQTC